MRPDLSQELSGVYASNNPEAYPISAYSYLVTQCAPSGQRATCKGNYGNPGVSETLSTWMRYIACEGQVNMARIGYSPLPPNLSQEMANSIARMQGGSPETLNSGNCANPRFSGSLGAGASSPKDPLAGKVASIPAAGGRATAAAAASGAGTGGTAAALAGGAGGTGLGAGGAAATGGLAGVVGRAGGAALAVGGGSNAWRDAAPVAYNRARPPGSSAVPVLMLLVLIAMPPLVLTHGRRFVPRTGRTFP